MELEQLAYEEAKRQIDRQSSNLDGLRSRAGILLAAISVTTSFFGGQALVEPGFSVWAGLATASFVGAAVACVAILWPTGKWKFDLSAAKILAQVERDERPSVAEAHRELALRTRLNYKTNEPRLDNLFVRFRVACGLLGFEIIFWIIALGA